ncbi:MAG: iron-only hydrogenase system regulator [Candidatus Omnitrophica bacterium]|nr:iron-only hydrogenase system regulator [Candidatus Omnitrophota bacterium]
MERRIGFVGILVESRKKTAAMINQILSDFAEIIVARVGVPYKERNVSVITLIVDATSDEIGALTGKLGSLDGVSVKSAFAKNGG